MLMNRISSDQRYSKETFFYTSSRLLERASFYGIRGLIFLYMIKGTIGISIQNAHNFYAWFVSSFVFSQILGAIIGDLIIGNKKAIIIGGILQAVGAFVLCIPSHFGLYLGMGLIVLGSGLYTPNILSQYGKLYLNKSELMDAGFTIFYEAVNVGAFIGGALIAYLGYPNFTYGFIAAGILMLISVSILLFNMDDISNLNLISSKNSFRMRSLNVIVSILIIGVFWGLYDYSQNGQTFLINKLENFILNFPKYIWSLVSHSIALIIGIIACLIWSYYYYSQLSKIVVGFLLASIALGILLFIPDKISDGSVLIFILSGLILSIAEIHIAPILYSILTKNTNPKYLAIVISLSFIPTSILQLMPGISFINKDIDGMLAIAISAIIFGIIGIGLFVYLFTKNKKLLNLER